MQTLSDDFQEFAMRLFFCKESFPDDLLSPVQCVCPLRFPMISVFQQGRRELSQYWVLCACSHLSLNLIAMSPSRRIVNEIGKHFLATAAELITCTKHGRIGGIIRMTGRFKGKKGLLRVRSQEEKLTRLWL